MTLMNSETYAWDERQVSVSSAVRIVRSRRTSGGRGLRRLQLPNRAHRERWDNRREIPFKAHLCGDPERLRRLPRRSRAVVFHLSRPGCRPSRVTGFGGAWDAIGGWKQFCQPVACACLPMRAPCLSALNLRTASGFRAVRRTLPSGCFSSFQAREGAVLPLRSAAISA